MWTAYIGFFALVAVVFFVGVLSQRKRHESIA